VRIGNRGRSRRDGEGMGGQPDGLIQACGGGLLEKELELRPLDSELKNRRRADFRLGDAFAIQPGTVGAVQITHAENGSVSYDFEVIERDDGGVRAADDHIVIGRASYAGGAIRDRKSRAGLRP
jgi:hypothetical protein